MQSFITDMLQCPQCRGELEWRIEQEANGRIENGAARCRDCGAEYPIREGIGVFLSPDLHREDLWEAVASELTQYLQAHPEVERQLMEPPLSQLSPADQYYRAAVLEERGDFAQARLTYTAANHGLYTPEYLICHESQIHYVLDHLSGSSAPVVDLASGLGELVEAMAQSCPRPVIASDFSPRVLLRDRKRLEAFGLYERVSLLAFDARQMPFKDGAVETLTTNLGLANIRQPKANIRQPKANIRQPSQLLSELRRAVSGKLMGIHTFYPESDEANAEAIHELGLPLLFRSTAEAQFAAAGLKLQVVNACAGRAAPTPTSRLLDGAGIDSLPVHETMLEWCTLEVGKENH